jgi:hypothetical protein
MKMAKTARVRFKEFSWCSIFDANTGFWGLHFVPRIVMLYVRKAAGEILTALVPTQRWQVDRVRIEQYQHKFEII